jgi:hypothetical protein
MLSASLQARSTALKEVESVVAALIKRTLYSSVRLQWDFQDTNQSGMVNGYGRKSTVFESHHNALTPMPLSSKPFLVLPNYGLSVYRCNTSAQNMLNFR